MRNRLPFSALALVPAAAFAQSTAFTYQGQLNEGGTPANGLHDFRFKLFDAAGGGTQIGAAQCVDNLLVTDGRFAATIDFGNQFVTPGPRFIEIDVRRDTGLNCSNSSDFVTLSSRQLITATPLAVHAKSAFSLDAPNGSIANAVFVDNTGKVGIGTTTPTQPLHIAAIEPTIALQDTNSTTDQVGYISYRDSGNVERGWIGYGSPGDPDLSILNARPAGDVVLNSFFGALQIITNGSERMKIDSLGSVGIGTTSPLAMLDVRGDIRFGPTGQFRATGSSEDLRIVRGTMGWNGAVIHGNGFSVQRLAEGRYTVTFTTPFAATPTVTATAHGLQSGDVNLYGVSMPAGATTSSVTFCVGWTDDGSAADRDVDFIAIGPR